MSFSRAPRTGSDRSNNAVRRGSIATLAACLVIVAAIATLEGVVSTGSGSAWFDRSAQVIWTPALWLARIVWAVVFLLLALSGWRIWRQAIDRYWRTPRVLYAVALALVGLWPPVYLDGYPLLGPTALWIGFAVAFALDCVLIVLIASTRHVAPVAAALLTPAAIWILYVTTINFGDAVLATLG